MPSPPAPLRTGLWPVVLFLLLAAGIAALWFSAIGAYRTAVLDERGRELRVIAESRIDFIRLWLDERRNDAVVQANRLLMANTLRPRGDAGAYSHSQVVDQLEAVRRAYNYKAVSLVDLDGNLRIGAGRLSDFGRDATAKAGRSAIASGKTLVSLAYHPEQGGRHHIDIDIAAPVADVRLPGAPTLGALVFHFDSRSHLDPLVGRWPTASASGEAFLFELVGDRIVVLSSLRQAEREALQRRADEAALPAALAARGSQGLLEGIDYRGVPVLAAVGRVPEMPWYVVAKLDRAEVLAPVRREALWSGTLSALLMLALGLALYSWQRRGRSELALARRAAAEEALAASEARFRKLTEYSWDYQLLYDRNMKIVHASPSVTRDLGYDLVGRHIGDGRATVHPEDVGKVEAARQSALAQPRLPQRIDHRLRRGDGIWIDVEAYFVNYFDDPDIRALSYVARDVSERLRTEAALRDSEERYRFLFELSPDAVFVHRDNVLLIANDAAARLFRAGSAQALTGLDWHELVAPEGWAATERRIAALMNGERSFLDPAEQRYRARDGAIIPVEATAARIVIGGRPAVMSVVRDIAERKQAEAERQAAERRLRDTLVREVHHRIKNHLQGLSGLLRQHVGGQPALKQVLEQFTTQVNAISVVHGLQGRTPGGRTSLRGLVMEIAAFLGGLLGTPLRLAESGDQCFMARPCDHGGECRLTIAEEESVPVALIVNELLTNAVRHRHGPAPLSLDIRCDERAALIAIRNPGRLGPDFDFARGQGLGTGLGLVRSLLPQKGMTLRLANADDGHVETRIELTAPLLQDALAVEPQLASRR